MREGKEQKLEGCIRYILFLHTFSGRFRGKGPVVRVQEVERCQGGIHRKEQKQERLEIWFLEIQRGRQCQETRETTG